MAASKQPQTPAIQAAPTVSPPGPLPDGAERHYLDLLSAIPQVDQSNPAIKRLAWSGALICHQLEELQAIIDDEGYMAATKSGTGIHPAVPTMSALHSKLVAVARAMRVLPSADARQQTAKAAAERAQGIRPISVPSGAQPDWRAMVRKQ